MMKGVIFTAFLDNVEERFGVGVTEEMISACNLATDGAYTAVGTYDHGEIVQMIVKLSELSGESISKLLIDFGANLFGSLVASYPNVVEHVDDSFGLITSIENHIHVEVRKLYPDAALPRFSHELLGPDELRLVYSSERGLADVAEGLLLGCFAYFDEVAEITREDLSEGNVQKVAFLIKRLN